MSRTVRPTDQRFLEKVNKTDTCWLWTAEITNAGYGAFRLGDKKAYAHRTSYSLFVGPIPQGMWICHRCDVKTCVNPDHLFLGTPLDNTHDMLQKGRGRKLKGSEVPLSKLSESTVKSIRLMRGLSTKEIAEVLSVTPAAIRQIKTNKTWRHV